MPRDSRGAVDEGRIESEIARIRSLSKDSLRLEWRNMFGKEVPKALTRDFLARMLIWRLQERVYGGFDRPTLKLLESYTKAKPGESQRLLRLKRGTEIVREYQGERYTVVVLRDGFVWRGTIYPSLTTIARLITGTNWNGPRFFGLRPTDRNSVRPGDAGDASRSSTRGARRSG